jgi:hypothetical protein
VRIYIDESGGFIPGIPASRVSCVVALAIPEGDAQELLRRYAALRATWTTAPEVKGSSLTDAQTLAALSIVAAFDVVAKIVALDMQFQSVDQIAGFQNGQGDAFISALTEAHSAASREWAHNARADWRSLPPQLAVQMYVMFLTLEEFLRDVPNYYAQRLPPELGRFDWCVDPKDVRIARYDDLWQRLVCPILQTMSLEKPAARVEGFDYSAFDRFEKPLPPYLRSLLPDRPGVRSTSPDLKMVLSESVSFPDSRSEIGLQLADIVASAFTKAMNGKLSERVWPVLGSLMIQRPQGEPPVRFVALGPREPRSSDPLRAGEHQRDVLTTLHLFCKPMLAT